MSDNASLLENMSRDYLEIELDAVKNENMLQSKRIEEYKLQIYKLKHRVAMSKSMEGYFSSEVESLKSIHDAKIEELLKKISIHEEQIHLLHEKHTEIIKYYEKELIKKETDLEYMIEVKKTSVQNDLLDEFKSKINDLTETLTANELKYEDLLLNKTILNDENIDLKNELSELKNQLHLKDMQLDEKEDLISNLQNEVVQIRSEINNIKTLTENS